MGACAVGDAEARLFSLSGRERLEKTFRRIGLSVLASPGEAERCEAVLVAHAGYVFDERVLADLARNRDAALIAEDDAGRETVVAAVCPAAEAGRWIERIEEAAPVDSLEGQGRLYTAAEVSGAFNRRLRKRENPVVLKASTARREALERRLFKGSYKGATDIVTKFVWPEPAFHVTRLAAALKLHPNLVTTLSLVLVFATMYLFAQGAFLAGLAAGWAMCFLDTVDGKLARVTLSSSKWGNVYDHGIDLIHPPFWYAAWAWGLVAHGTGGAEAALSADAVWLSLWVILAGYVLGRLLEGYFLRRFKIEMHIWRPVDYWFRHITARRNPNLLILTVATLAGAPGAGFVLVAVWTVLSILFHLVRVVAAETQASSGALQSWLAE
ncbi:CDP-alcohol phosphatidyltransferase family protein [Amphiplicatus metriothermophilus]|uniref:CDP-alcohol phosphatidyltransferase n=1 Tax=Amphiplicatus metriothermophilus TaxID=1519374 RepID=A0A239PUD4_9PROT|nr:CDP-alcohol phosphatidyltransferase family protein [Amphiplicatus metriothermophilus]MBB5519238.1 phosphatidylglycerophosphate synthase [Amphiplicatus metriothermophilus]SNT73307.1 CDP-alcohol phosphatidyltransferase [Amphiplicatus metriothermophilus]